MDWNIVGMALLSAGLLGAVWVLWRKYDASQCELHRLQEEVEQLHRVLSGQGTALRQMELQVKKLISSPKPQSLHLQRPTKTYRQASKMLAMGVEPDEIRQCCELTKGELELLMRMHAAQAKAQAH